MPLDPELRNILERISAIEEVDFEVMEAAQFRQLVDSADLSMRSEEISIKEIRDLNIQANGRGIKGRLYADSPESDSIIVFFHGGGFVFGNIETHDSICRIIARYSGSKVLSVDYGLAPENKFPAAVNDAYAAYVWTLDNAEKLGVRKDRVGLSGDSAGGNLCAVISVMARDNGREMPRIQTLYYPVVAADTASKSHREFSRGYFLTGTMSAWFMKQYMNSEADLINPHFSVLNTEDLSRLPETLVFTAEFDPLRDQGETFVSRLKESGNRATGIRALGMVHGFISFFEFSSSARNFLIMGSKLMGEFLNK